MSKVQFTATKDESRLIREIAIRADAIAKRHGVELSRMDTIMDVEATHCNGNPLQLDELLAADDFNFAHDVFGIHRHLDRMTGKLGDCFSPRFSAK